MKFVSAIVAVLIGIGLLSAPVASATSADVTVQVGRQEMINRAKVWLTANNGKQVPYSQSKKWNGYRQDCSGYVSMAAKLAKPGPNTVGLFDSHTVAINKNDMKMGDLFIDKIGNGNTRHVVIFEKWTDAGHTKYWAYEQRGGHGTDHRILSYGLGGGSEYKARRLKTITG